MKKYQYNQKYPDTFHIFNLDSKINYYSVAITTYIKDEKDRLVLQILDCLKSSDDNNLKVINGYIKEINENQVTLRSKLLNMLKELNIYDLKTEAIVGRYIGHRNAIGHGRKNLYQDKLVFSFETFLFFY
jgi:hypothetical protein